MLKCLDVFRERLDYTIENTVPAKKIPNSKWHEMYKDFPALIATDQEKNTLKCIQMLFIT